jgi:chaperonin GroES
VPDRKLEIQLLFNPEDQFEVEIQGDGHLVVRERDVHAVATERNDDGTGLYL